MTETQADSRRRIRQRYRDLWDRLNERERRQFAASEARAYGRGGVSLLHSITGIARSTITRGLKEIGADPPLASERVRRPGAGRKRRYFWDSKLPHDLRRLVEPRKRDGRLQLVDWTIRTLRPLSRSLNAQGHSVSPHLVADCLRGLGYTLQSNRRTREPSGRIDRDAQFRHINEQAAAFLMEGGPVIALDTKMETMPGIIRNGGRKSSPAVGPGQIGALDRLDKRLEVAFPCGVGALLDNKGWINVGMEHATATFAVDAVRRWWHTAGRVRYPRATRLMIATDGAGSNGHRVALWKIELQNLANELRLPITVCHVPSATLKWNNIEHQFLSFVTLKTESGTPERSFRTTVNSVADLSTSAELKVSLELDENRYPEAAKDMDTDIGAISLRPDSFQGLWNYTISAQ